MKKKKAEEEKKITLNYYDNYTSFSKLWFVHIAYFLLIHITKAFQ